MLRSLCLASALLAAQLPASAQECPGGAAKIVVGLAAGGGTDAIARMLAQGITARFNRQVIVENRVGAAGNLASEHVARSAKDGCTVILKGSEHNANPHIYGRAGYEARDFDPVARVVVGPTVIVANAALPFKTIGELVSYARANPGKLSYGTSGVGSATHLAMELFNRAAKVNTVHIPYKGGAPSMNDTVAGVTPLAVSGITVAVPFVQAGRVNALAVSTANRWDALPGTPTLIEAGFPEARYDYWMGLLAPAGTPRALREKWNQEVRAVLEEAPVRERLLAMGYMGAAIGIDEFNRFLQDDERMHRRLIQDLKIKAD